MNRHTFARLIYRALLRLHPTPFRNRFQEEMLWIFDQGADRGQTGRLLCDGLLSLVRQHATAERYEEVSQPAFGVQIATSGMTVLRLAQAGAIATFLLLASLWLVGRGMPSLQQIHRFDAVIAGQQARHHETGLR